MAFPALAPQLRSVIDRAFPGFWDWYQKAKAIWDILSGDKGGCLILQNEARTITKRVRLNNAGNGIIIEDL